MPEHLFAPSGAGVIREIEPIASGNRVTLESGATFDLGTGAIPSVESSTGSKVGALLIYGDDDGQPWVSKWRRALDTDDGWVLISSAWERPNEFIFLSGLRLPKASEYRRDPVGRSPSEDGFYEIAMFIANEPGEITLSR